MFASRIRIWLLSFASLCVGSSLSLAFGCERPFIIREIATSKNREKIIHKSGEMIELPYPMNSYYTHQVPATSQSLSVGSSLSRLGVRVRFCCLVYAVSVLVSRVLVRFRSKYTHTHTHMRTHTQGPGSDEVESSVEALLVPRAINHYIKLFLRLVYALCQARLDPPFLKHVCGILHVGGREGVNRDLASLGPSKSRVTMRQSRSGVTLFSCMHP